MARLLHVLFKAEEIQQLMDLNPDKIIIRTSLESGVLANGESIGYVKVEADAMKDGEEEPIGTIEGCPQPPC